MEYLGAARRVRVNLVFGHDDVVAAWAEKRFGYEIPNRFCSVGVIRADGSLCGAAVFHNFNRANVEISFYGPRAITLGVAVGLMQFVFERFKISRVTAMTQRANRSVVKGLPKVGFKFEGVARRFYGDRKRLDGIMFGLTRQDAMAFLERRGKK